MLRNPNCEWREIPSLPSSAYSILASKFRPLTSVVDSRIDSSDQVTTKLLIKLQVVWSFFFFGVSESLGDVMAGDLIPWAFSSYLVEWRIYRGSGDEVWYTIGEVWREASARWSAVDVVHILSGDWGMIQCIEHWLFVIVFYFHSYDGQFDRFLVLL